jgi:DNA-binding FrmR family transcriptional regulator
VRRVFTRLPTSPLCFGHCLTARIYFSRKTRPCHTHQESHWQLESVLRGLNEDEQCAEVLRRLAAARGAINSFMGELMDDHIRKHMPRNSKSSEEAADDVIQSSGPI